MERASIRPTRQNSERSNDASPNKTTWDVLEVEEDFLQSFVDYVERERACGEIKRLSMTDGRIDKYVAAFELLAHRAPSIKLDDPANLRTFARGLPRRLARKMHGYRRRLLNGQTRQHKNWLKRVSIREDSYDTVCNTEKKNQPRSTKRWGWQHTGRPDERGPWGATPDSDTPIYLIPPDYDVDETDGIAIARKATNEMKRKRTRRGREMPRMLE